jgi:hypothetical protein
MVTVKMSQSDHGRNPLILLLESYMLIDIVATRVPWKKESRFWRQSSDSLSHPRVTMQAPTLHSQCGPLKGVK